MFNIITIDNFNEEIEKNLDLYNIFEVYEKIDNKILSDNISFIIDISSLNDLSEKTGISKNKIKKAISGQKLNLDEYIKIITYPYFNQENIFLNKIKFKDYKDMNKKEVIEALKKKINE